MRFFLDQNVDARVAGVLRDLGHEAWTAEESGLSREADPNLSIYAHDRHAVLVTHDRAFSNRVRRNLHGHHLFLDCRNVAARTVIARFAEEAVLIFERHQDVVVALSQDEVKISYPSQVW